MVNIVGVRFRNAGKLYFFDPGRNWPVPGDYVVAETAHGVMLGETVTEIHQLEESELREPLQPILRVATRQDLQHDGENREVEQRAFEVGREKIREHKLDMKLIGVVSTLDNARLIYYFSAENRVDFRALVRDLAACFHTRIEMRQIGVRDEARMVGGLGVCGRTICCGGFLGDFQPVSIKMAKEQSLSLNPTKISGICGKLMCCLRFEEQQYEQTRKGMPRIGREIQTPDGPGKVTDLHILRETVRVQVSKGDSYEVHEYPMSALRALNEQPAEEPKPEVKSEAKPEPQGRSMPKPVARTAPKNPPAAKAEPKPQPAAKPEPKPQPAAKPEPAPKPEGAKSKPNANAWRDALNRAMKAAGEGEKPAE